MLAGWRRDQISVEAEIGSERDRGSNVLQDAFSFRGCDSRLFQMCDSLCRGFQPYGHRNGPCDGGSGHRRRSLFLQLPVSNFEIYTVVLEGPNVK